MKATCLLAILLAVLTVPLLLLWRMTETQPQRIRRMSRQGMSQRAIAERLQVTRYRVQKALA